MNMRLEVVTLPVADVERAKTFYINKLQFNVDHDSQVSDSVRLVQLTPLGSACSIQIGTGIPELDGVQPGSVKRLHLVVDDIQKVHKILVERGVQVSEIETFRGRIQLATFSDPDGNSWVLQEM